MNISIIDNSIEIDEKFQEDIFIIFKSIHDKISYYGSGIGLAFCKKIVASHGGKIWVESKVKQGSSFYLTIPRKPIHSNNVRTHLSQQNAETREYSSYS